MNGRGTHAGLPDYFLNADAMPRLEPDTVAIDQADDGNRHLEQVRRNGRNAIKRDFRWRIQNLVMTQLLQPLGLVI